MQNPNKLALFIAIEGYKNGELSEKLIRDAVDAYSSALLQQTPVSGSLPLTEIVYLLRVNQPKNCPNWIEGKGDCGSMTCLACRTQKCIDELESGNDR